MPCMLHSCNLIFYDKLRFKKITTQIINTTTYASPYLLLKGLLTFMAVFQLIYCILQAELSGKKYCRKFATPPSKYQEKKTLGLCGVNVDVSVSFQ